MCHYNLFPELKQNLQRHLLLWNKVTLLPTKDILWKAGSSAGGTPYTGKEILAQRKKENDDNLLMIEQFPMDGRLLEVLVVEGDLLLCCLLSLWILPRLIEKWRGGPKLGLTKDV